MLVGRSGQTAPPRLFFATSWVFTCMHARAHTGLRSHVTFFHGKRVEECYTSDSARASATNALVGPDTHRCGIAGKPNHDTILPRLRTPVHTACSTAATVLPSTALLPPASSDAAPRVAKTKTPRSRSETSWRTRD